MDRLSAEGKFNGIGTDNMIQDSLYFKTQIIVSIVQYSVHTLGQNSSKDRTFGLCSGDIHEGILHTKGTRNRKGSKNKK